MCRARASLKCIQVMGYGATVRVPWPGVRISEWYSGLMRPAVVRRSGYSFAISGLPSGDSGSRYTGSGS